MSVKEKKPDNRPEMRERERGGGAEMSGKGSPTVRWAPFRPCEERANAFRLRELSLGARARARPPQIPLDQYRQKIIKVFLLSPVSRSRRFRALVRITN